jgi:hypothetical protein
MARIWDSWLLENRGAVSIPLILPVVISHTRGGWSQAVSLRDLFAVPPQVRQAVVPFVPELSFAIDDLTLCSDEQIVGRDMQPLATLALLLLRHARDEHGLVEQLFEWAPLLKAVWISEGGRESIAMAVRYLLLANKQATMQTLVNALIQILGEEAGDMVMTETQKLMVEAETRGEARALTRAVVDLLDARKLSVSSELRARILGCSDPAQLRRWLVRAATAQSAEDAISE